jgi:hypothetical protein
MNWPKMLTAIIYCLLLAPSDSKAQEATYAGTGRIEPKPGTDVPGYLAKQVVE